MADAAILARRERHRRYADDLLAQQRQRRSALVPLGITLTASLIAAVVALVDASNTTQTVAAGVGAIGFGILGSNLYQQWREARRRLVTAALRAEMLRPPEAAELEYGRDIGELVRDVEKRTGEDWETIWSNLPDVLAEEEVAIALTTEARARDRTPLSTAKVQLYAAVASGIAAAVVYLLFVAGNLPGFLRWADTMITLPLGFRAFSVRGLVAVGLAMMAVQVVLRLRYPSLLNTTALRLADDPEKPLSQVFVQLARESAQRVLTALPLQVLGAALFAIFIFATKADGGSAPSTIFLTAYVILCVLSFAYLEDKNLRSISKHVPDVVASISDGEVSRVSLRKLAALLKDLTGTSFDAAGVARSLLNQGGLNARFWLV